MVGHWSSMWEVLGSVLKYYQERKIIEERAATGNGL